MSTAWPWKDRSFNQKVSPMSWPSSVTHVLATCREGESNALATECTNHEMRPDFSSHKLPVAPLPNARRLSHEPVGHDSTRAFIFTRPGTERWCNPCGLCVSYRPT